MVSAASVCFLGNSHLACLKLAADREPALIPGGQADWFAGSAASLYGLQLKQGRFLIPRTQRLKAQMAAVSGGVTQVDLADYGLFVIVGVGFDYRDVFRLFRTHCLASDVALNRQAGRAPVSASFFRAYLADTDAQRPGSWIARQIRAVNPAARVVFLPAPFPSETILDHPRESGALSRLKGSACFADMAEIHLTAARAAAEAVGASLAPQGSETQAAPGFTQARYNVRAVGLQSPHHGESENWHGEKSTYDPWHMNADLGRARLRDLASVLRMIFPSAPETASESTQ